MLVGNQFYCCPFQPESMNLKFILPLLLLPALTQAQLVINELMPKNVSYVMDDAYNFSMWVEVYNPTDEAQNLSNFYFTNKATTSTEWRPKSQIVPAKGYQVLYFEREERDGHASFKLDPEGGSLFLYNLSLALVDEVEYPEQHRNISYGRLTDGAASWAFFESPSPGASNDGKPSADTRCADPVFLLKNGFYTTTQTLHFEAQTDGETIYYTTDNTEPTTSSLLYDASAGINLNNTVVIHAKAFKTGKLSSDVVSSTFFIKERKSALRVVSIAMAPMASQETCRKPQKTSIRIGTGLSALNFLMKMACRSSIKNWISALWEEALAKAHSSPFPFPRRKNLARTN
jgi:hypothetical protein